MILRVCLVVVNFFRHTHRPCTLGIRDSRSCWIRFFLTPWASESKCFIHKDKKNVENLKPPKCTFKKHLGFNKVFVWCLKALKMETERHSICHEEPWTMEFWDKVFMEVGWCLGLGQQQTPVSVLLLMAEIRLTTWDVWNPINNGINYLSTGAGFQPSTVSLSWCFFKW